MTEGAPVPHFLFCQILLRGRIGLLSLLVCFLVLFTQEAGWYPL